MGLVRACFRGAGHAIAALGALRARHATEIEALDDARVTPKPVLRETEYTRKRRFFRRQ